MGNIVEFAQRKAAWSRHRAPEVDVIQLARNASEMQESVRRAITVALFGLEMILIRCRSEIASIPAQQSVKKRKLEADLEAIERVMFTARALAAEL